MEKILQCDRSALKAHTEMRTTFKPEFSSWDQIFSVILSMQRFSFFRALWNLTSKPTTVNSILIFMHNNHKPTLHRFDNSNWQLNLKYTFSSKIDACVGGCVVEIQCTTRLSLDKLVILKHQHHLHEARAEICSFKYLFILLMTLPLKSSANSR